MFNVQYQDQSGFQAMFVSDILFIESISLPIYFGSITNEVRKGNISFQPFLIDGIWGLAYSSLSLVPTVLDQIVMALKLPNVFSLCSSAVGGAMTIGESFATDLSLLWTPIVSPKYYSVELLDVLVGTISLGLPSQIYNEYQTVVDSGSTLVILPKPAFMQIERVMQDLCLHGWKLPGVCGLNINASFFSGKCFNLSQREADLFPTIYFVFPSATQAGYTFSIPMAPYKYLRQGWCGDKHLFSLGISMAADRSSTTLGMLCLFH